MRKRVLNEFSESKGMGRGKGYLLPLWWKSIVEVSHFCPKMITVFQCSDEAPHFPPLSPFQARQTLSFILGAEYMTQIPSQWEPHAPRLGGLAPEATGCLSILVWFLGRDGCFCQLCLILGVVALERLPPWSHHKELETQTPHSGKQN